METCGSCSSNDLPKGCKNNGACGTGSCNTKLSVFDWLSNIHSPILENQPQYIEVRFKNDRKDFYKNDSSLPISIGDVVAVEGNSGHDIGVVSLTGELVKVQMRKKKAKLEEIHKVYRKATAKDIEIWQNNRNKENAVMLEARRIAKGLGLQMKICDAEYQGDGSKVTLYYTAEGRVDFRQLIKDYAMAFRSKIDMRQIGYRQESAKVGGIGSCGRELCCSTWLTDFRSVNTAAARYQQLSINPQKLAGQCGKLKCCLNFELDTYVDALADFPSNQTVLNTEKGKAYCIKVDVFRKQMWFTYADNSISWYPIDIYDLQKLIELNKKGIDIKPLDELKEKEALKIDLIEENNLNRFENRNRSNNKRKNKNKSQQRKTNKAASPNPSNESKPAVNNSNQKKRAPKRPK
ncbi:regulatory iron-sulfur-containing complex subunit RicT [Apibacter sp. HY039]|uniref:PSP1 domain-containing protein n=1 Tax=Apibacter sp. HY039 TaxID=2501476 RepID=UPI000FEBB4F8|nr:regulatory iron-sulfur-containing complex subunit RicT [Apibacter sp. HY039]